MLWVNLHLLLVLQTLMTALRRIQKEVLSVFIFDSEQVWLIVVVLRYYFV